MSDEDGFESERTWLQRAAMLLRRESTLRWKVGVFFFGGLVLGGAVNAAEYGLRMGAVIEGLGWGVVIGLVLAFIAVDNRMETVFPDHGDDEEDAADAEDSLRARYVRGEIDHETFRRRLDEKLREPMDDGDGATGGDESAGGDGMDLAGGDRTGQVDDPVVALRARFARGEIDEDEYRDRLATLRETVESADAPPAEREPEHE